MTWIGDISPQMLVLGLVIQQPDTTAGVTSRMTEYFPTTPFSKGFAHGNLPSLAEKGYVRLIEPGPPGQPTLDVYEAMAEGRQYFFDWLRDFDLTLGVRDVLQCKMAFIEPSELSSFVHVVKGLERAFTEMCDTAHARLIREKRTARMRERQGRSVDWRAKLRGIQNKDNVNLLSMHAQRLEYLGEELEKLLEEMSSGRVSVE